MNKSRTASCSTLQKLLVIFIFLLSANALNSCSTLKDLLNHNSPTLVPSQITNVHNTFYVDHSLGSDSNAGTQAQPWITIQKAANMAHAGDTINVLAGDYEERVQVTNSGESGAPITFQAKGVITMQGFTVKADYITIKGFEIINTPDDAQNGIGIFVQGSDCDLEENYIHFATRGGILLFANLGDYAQTSNCTVRNNRLYHNSQNGIDVRGLNHIIEGNEIWASIQYHPNWKNPPSWVDADGILFFGSGHVFRKNYIHDINYSDPLNVNPHIDCFQTFSDANHEEASNIVIEQNRCNNNALAHSSDEGGTGLTIRNGAGNIIIRNNLIIAFVNIFLQNSNGVFILNNTMIGNTAQNPNFYPGGVSLNQSSNTVIENNIFFNQPGNIIYVKGQKPVSGRNMVYRDDGRPISSTDTYDPTNDLFWGINPQFVDPQAGDYSLQAGSPAINAGYDLGNLVSNDFADTVRPKGAGYDIGAYEHTP